MMKEFLTLWATLFLSSVVCGAAIIGFIYLASLIYHYIGPVGVLYFALFFVSGIIAFLIAQVD